MGTVSAHIQAEFDFTFAGGIRIVGEALNKIHEDAAGRLSRISIPEIVRGGSGADEAGRELRELAGDLLGRVTRGAYDRRKYRARGALRSLLSAVEYAEWGMTSEALEAMREALRESGAALAK